MQPAVPTRRRHRGFGDAIVDDPAALETKRGIDLAAARAIIGVAEFVVTDELAVSVGVVRVFRFAPFHQVKKRSKNSLIDMAGLLRGAGSRRTMASAHRNV